MNPLFPVVFGVLNHGRTANKSGYWHIYSGRGYRHFYELLSYHNMESIFPVIFGILNHGRTANKLGYRHFSGLVFFLRNIQSYIA